MYWVIDLNNEATGPYDSRSKAEEFVSGGNEIIVKECPKENQLGAPDVYPFNTEDYPDDKDG